MKYMGSKRSMLRNGLGQLILELSEGFDRFVDLFCGSASVSSFVAHHTQMPVLAVDLQKYSTVLASAVITRDRPLSSEELETLWLNTVIQSRNNLPTWQLALRLEEKRKDTAIWVRSARKLCQTKLDIGPIWNAYGGHYFSPSQALTFDLMLRHLPTEPIKRTICLASVIIAASECAAAPGHTAQPFQPTETAAPFIEEAWLRDPIEVSRDVLRDLCPLHANVCGESVIDDALIIGGTLNEKDLVFVDPPYSNVHYSRFYHVLETLARGTCGTITGTGRYPPINERPLSDFSKKSTSAKALDDLLETLSRARATTIFTFPSGQCSNGLSGQIVIERAKRFFRVEQKIVNGQFSTLGGNNNHRASRQSAAELMLTLHPL